jgi:radical SAM superfamily enzyme YgiQ (UPF0313 family)
MSRQVPLRVVLLKPSKYAVDGSVERFRRGFMPNSTVTFLKSLTPADVDGTPCEMIAVDEYVHTDLEYLSLLSPTAGRRTLLALVGVQSHQFQRALDLAALARSRGVENVVLGGPHPMTCDSSAFHGLGVSFALAEAEIIWPAILRDAIEGELLPTYGEDRRWGERLDPPALVPPSRRDLRRYAVPMLGVYPARGCPYTCNFCSVIKIAGRQVRSQPVATTIASLKAAAAAGVRLVMFTSDNFNKYSEVFSLLDAMIEEKIRLPFFVQCDAQVHRQEDLIAKLARAGCFQMFVGVESFSREALRDAHKLQNHPEHYARIVELCRAHGITSHFSNILGFPTDTEKAIREHADALRALAPDVASFYILTPIPGTEQYDDFLAAGLITELNLDRFDGAEVTWRHPFLPPERLTDLLYRCYRDFYSARHIGVRFADRLLKRPDFRFLAALLGIAGYGVQSRCAAAQRMHPMAGGTFRVRRDRAEDYRPLRRRHFGCDLVPLPQSLALTAADREINQRAKLVAIGAGR